MTLDFSKLGTGQSVDTVLKPREIFNALPNKDSKKFQYPRDVQTQVWSKWFDRRDESNLVIKMNTGGGKTAVGLIILKSCLNEQKGPAVYVVPDNYLVKQVIEESKALGLEVVQDPKDERFLKGKAILVINIYKLVNGKSVFGIGDQGVKIPITSILIDDAHTCLGTIEEQFSLKISNKNPIYSKILNTFEAAMKQQSEPKLYEISAGDPLTYIQIPYWEWQSKISEITQFLIDEKEHEEIKYKWPLIKEDISRCSCVISKSNIEISVNCIPIDLIPSIRQVERKVFMTATLSDDSVLATHFGISSQNLSNPITPDTAGDVGDRIILFPQALNSNMFDSDVKAICTEIAKIHNVVVIVPSKSRADFWNDVSALILDKETIHTGIEQLKNRHIGLAVLINRYDGIDLPDDTCRLLVIDGLPDPRSKLEKIRQNQLSGSTYWANEIIHLIEQGIGRGIRSNDDYCVVFLMGKDLTSQLYMERNLGLFSPATKAQLKLSEQVAEQIKDKGAQELNEVINYCLNRDPNWVKASRGVLAALNYSDQNTTNKVQVAIREAFDFDRLSQPQRAANRILEEINNLQNSSLLKGFLKQTMAEYINQYDPVEAQKTQLSAIADNIQLLKPLKGITYRTLDANSSSQAVACTAFLKEKFKNGNELIIYSEGVLSNLSFNLDSSSKFEQSLKELAFLLGFIGQRPENDYGKGPDNLWLLDEQNFLVIECKNRSETSFISKHDCNQLNGSEIWFKTQYTVGKCVPIMIHSSTCFEFACSPSSTIKIMNKEFLNKFVSSIRDFIKSIANNNEYADSRIVEASLIHHKLKHLNIVDYFTTNFTVKSSSRK
jgi:hypothetical protein